MRFNQRPAKTYVYNFRVVDPSEATVFQTDSEVAAREEANRLQAVHGGAYTVWHRTGMDVYTVGSNT